MAKCTIMKLNESVNNPNLIGINETKLVYRKRSDDISVASITLSNISSIPYVVRIIGDNYFTDSTGTENYGITATAVLGGNTFYIKNKDCELVIGDKHKVSVINTSGSGVTVIGKGFLVDTENIRYMERLNGVYCLAGGLRGKLSDLSGLALLSNLTVPSLSRSNLLTGDLSDLSELTALKYLSLAYQSGVSGDIASLNSVPIEYLSTIGTQIHGDLSSMKDKKNLRYVGGTSTMDYQYSDPTPRASDSYVMALNEINLKDDVDNYLIANAGCLKHPNVNSIVLWGNRTSSSDSAVTAIKALGYTIMLNREVL